MIKNIFELFKNDNSKKYLIFNIFRSKYCIFVFTLGLIGGYYLVPEKIFSGSLFLIGILYVIVFSLVSTCLVRVVKEKAVNMKNTGAGMISIVAAVFGIGAMQVCGIGAPICGATVGVGIFSLLFPNISMSFFSEYALAIIIFSIVVQFMSLYYMKCFKGYLNKVNK